MNCHKVGLDSRYSRNSHRSQPPVSVFRLAGACECFGGSAVTVPSLSNTAQLSAKVHDRLLEEIPPGAQRTREFRFCLSLPGVKDWLECDRFVGLRTNIENRNFNIWFIFYCRTLLFTEHKGARGEPIMWCLKHLVTICCTVPLVSFMIMPLVSGDTTPKLVPWPQTYKNMQPPDS